MKNYVSNENLKTREKIYKNFKTILLNGYIYRGDNHHKNNLVNTPKFFGVYESAKKYVYKTGEYLKRYKTKGKLRILDLNNTPENIKKVIDFLKDNQNNDTDMTILLLQIFNGFYTDKSDIINIEKRQIYKYFKKQKVPLLFIHLLLRLITIAKTLNLKPGRVSVSYFDKIVMRNLKSIFSPLNFHGFYYLHDKQSSIAMCAHVNETFEIASCVPTEICIFTPNKDLDFVGIKIREGNKLVFVT
jgi:hypothetical protein